MAAILSPNTTAIRGKLAKPVIYARVAAKVRPRSANGFWMTPSCFSKRSGQAQENAPPGTGAELLRDLEMVVAIVNRAQRRLAGARCHGVG